MEIAYSYKLTNGSTDEVLFAGDIELDVAQLKAHCMAIEIAAACGEGDVNILHVEDGEETMCENVEYIRGSYTPTWSHYDYMLSRWVAKGENVTAERMAKVEAVQDNLRRALSMAA